MINLFSIFDPSSFFNLNWIIFILPLLIINSFLWVYPYPFIILRNFIKRFLKLELKLILSISSFSIFYFRVTLFIRILIFNTLGIFPYIFTLTRHLRVTLSIALPIWLSYILFNLIRQTKSFFCHLVPLGTPPYLIPIIVLIESVRLLIRPITLSVRLVANIVAGHLLISLISSINSYFINIYRYLGQLLLNILELAVAGIQAYVFIILLSLYVSEVK